MTVADEFEAFSEAFKQVEQRRHAAGQCIGCGAAFLLGGKNAELEETVGDYLQIGMRICFWCLVEEEYDREDPQPSRYHYGNC